LDDFLGQKHLRNLLDVLAVRGQEVESVGVRLADDASRLKRRRD